MEKSKDPEFGKDYFYDIGYDIYTDDNNLARSVLITDYKKDPGGLFKVTYKIHWNSRGAYINFYGKRIYILEN